MISFSFSRCTESNALEKSTNISIVGRFLAFVPLPSIKRQIVRIWPSAERFVENHFDLFEGYFQVLDVSYSGGEGCKFSQRWQ